VIDDGMTGAKSSTGDAKARGWPHAPQRAETVDAETAVTPIRIQGLAGIVTDIADVV
jgi:hypothetical protein